MKIIKKGAKGDSVKDLQGKLGQLGFKLEADGIFGDDTERAVTDLQTMFGYDVDGLVGEGTMGLIDAQIGYGWNVQQPDAQEKALRAQGKDPAKELAGKVDKKAPAKGDPGKVVKK